MDFQSYSKLSYLNGVISFKVGNTTYNLKFSQECETEDGEEPKFWQMTVEGSNYPDLTFQMTPYHLPWSMPGKIEIRALELLPGVDHELVLAFANAVICGFGFHLQQLITTEDEIPDWMFKVFTIIDDLTDDFSGNTVPGNWFNEE